MNQLTFHNKFKVRVQLKTLTAMSPYSGDGFFLNTPRHHYMVTAICLLHAASPIHGEALCLLTYKRISVAPSEVLCKNIKVSITCRKYRNTVTKYLSPKYGDIA